MIRFTFWLTSYFSANMTLHAAQNQILQTMHSHKAEMEGLLYRILTEKSERQTVVELQRSGEHVAEQIMAAAQTVGNRYYVAPSFMILPLC